MANIREQSNKLLEDIEKDIDVYYRSVGDKLNAMQKKLLSNHYRELEAKKDELENGDITNDEYREWLRKQAISETVRNAAKKLTKETVKADNKAADIINGALAGVYAVNRLASQKNAAEQARKYGVDTKITEMSKSEIIDEYKKRAKQREKDKAMFQAIINNAKDTSWTEKHFNAAMQHGVRAGYSEKKMEEAVRSALSENYRSSIRYARTYVTANEGLAVFENGLQMDADGWKVEKEWQSHHDERTRDSHKKQNRETIDINERFENELLYPGDRSTNDPGEFINCRCRIEIKIVGIKDDQS